MRSTGDVSQALNLFEPGLSLTQGRMVVSDVFFVAWIGNLIITDDVLLSPVSLPLNGQS